MTNLLYMLNSKTNSSIQNIIINICKQNFVLCSDLLDQLLNMNCTSLHAKLIGKLCSLFGNQFFIKK